MVRGGNPTECNIIQMYIGNTTFRDIFKRISRVRLTSNDEDQCTTTKELKDIMDSAIYVMEQNQPRMKRGITEVIMNTFGMASTRQLDASWQNEQALRSTEKDIIHALAQGERNFKLIEKNINDEIHDIHAIFKEEKNMEQKIEQIHETLRLEQVHIARIKLNQNRKMILVNNNNIFSEFQRRLEDLKQ